ncbi:otolith matrix protein OMM-64-like isoform X2 [Pectinophora gossypiella]|uniref:otolith matrix protein OMM-64-like isoform X2 n=1 Tax=Pectinophora gossypiella TaxID=13191 RepID=UPI00214E3BF9|nr:otolith matrix protein OMM-64-like isoform X2 [Pectinophora gossypiella]
MFKPWICLFVLGVAVCSVTAQDYWDNYEEFWSKEALDDDLGVADAINKQDDDVVPVDEEIDGFKEPADTADAIDPDVKGDDVPLDNVADASNANDDTKDDDVLDTRENDQAVQEEIEQFRKELKQPEADVVDPDDYQFEDNRSDVKDEAAQEEIEAALPNDNDRNIDPEYMDEDAFPILPGAIALDEDQIVDDAKKLLEEEDSPFEEDMEENQPQNADEETQVESEPKLEETILDAVQPDLADDSFDDTIKEKQIKDIDNFLDEDKNNDENEDVPEENVVAEEPPLPNLADDMVELDDNDDELKDISEEEDNILNVNVLAGQNEDVVAEEPPVPEISDDMVELDDKDDELKDISEEEDNILNVDVLASKKDDVVADKIDDEIIEDHDDEMLEDNADDDMDVPLENNNKALPEGDQVAEDEDTVDKVYADLHADLAKLFETWDKLQDDSEEDTDVLEYEEKFGKPFREDIVLSQRDDYDNYYDNADDVDTNLDDIFADKSKAESEENVEVDEPLFPFDDALVNLPNDEKEISLENDAFIADAPEKKSEEIVNDAKIEQPPTSPQIVADTSSPETTTAVTITPEKYDEMMADFAKGIANELDTQREDFGKNIAAIHLTLSAEEAVEITSPNYPSAYPTNNVVDWVLEGDGSGIELNVTDLAVRGAQNDYLLIKPGGVDSTGTDGLVFSFHLSEPRSYRWTEVDRVFVRFVSGTGLNVQRGFHMSVKMIWPPIIEEEEEPEPEPLLPTPPATFTVNLGGVSVQEFMELEDEFLRIIADMATMYINANGLEQGLNTTTEVAQITSIRHCNINWVNFEGCVDVTFGIPLVYEDQESSRLNEEDLAAMWETYVDQDPFAQRLSSLGISVFPVPNDGQVLMAWMVLGVGVIISAAMLAFALWRYSCFDSYTRMKSFSDTDSIRDEKRDLDLYPTPHQTLPPLYADNDYKWADAKYEDSTRVDMGGFTNTSYVRDELFDIDSDEDVVTPRDGYTTEV